jgi:hypothetical protein
MLLSKRLPGNLPTRHYLSGAIHEANLPQTTRFAVPKVDPAASLPSFLALHPAFRNANFFYLS